MKQGYLALTIPLLINGLVGAAHADCAAEGYDTPVTNPSTALNDKRIITDDGQSREDHCGNGNLFKVGNPAKPAIDPRAFRGTWSSSAATAKDAPGSVTYNYTVGGTKSYTFYLYEDGSGNLCWQDGSKNVVATAAKPGGITESCAH